MRKLIFAANATIDGFADHTAVIADDELHDFYTNLLDDVDILCLAAKHTSLWKATGLRHLKIQKLPRV